MAVKDIETKGNNSPTLEEEHDADSSSVFFARVPPTVQVEELEALFGAFGTVVNIKLFKRWATARTTKGCGIVTFAEEAHAAAAMVALNGTHKWQDSESCMVVEKLDTTRASQQRQQQGSKPAQEAAASHAPSKAKASNSSCTRPHKAAESSAHLAKQATATKLQSVLQNTLLVPSVGQQSQLPASTCPGSLNYGFADTCSLGPWSACYSTDQAMMAAPVHLVSAMSAARQALPLQTTAGQSSSNDLPSPVQLPGLAPFSLGCPPSDQIVVPDMCSTSSNCNVVGSAPVCAVAASAAVNHCTQEPCLSGNLLQLSDPWLDIGTSDALSFCAPQLQQLQLHMPGAADLSCTLQRATMQDLVPASCNMSAPLNMDPMTDINWPKQQLQGMTPGVQLQGGCVVPPIVLDVPDAAVAAVARSMAAVQQVSAAALTLVATSSGSVALQISGSAQDVQMALELCSLSMTMV